MQRCLCFSLRTGALIFGILEIIGAILGALFWSAFVFAFLPVLGNIISEAQNSTAADTNVTIFNLTLNENSTGLDQAEVDRAVLEFLSEGLQEFEEISVFFTPIILALCLLCLIFGSTLIHGIRKKSTCLLLTWLIYQAVMIVVDLCFDAYIYYTIDISAKHSTLLIMSFLITPLINILAFKIVYDLRKQILSQTKGVHF